QRRRRAERHQQADGGHAEQGQDPPVGTGGADPRRRQRQRRHPRVAAQLGQVPQAPVAGGERPGGGGVAEQVGEDEQGKVGAGERERRGLPVGQRRSPPGGVQDGQRREQLDGGEAGADPDHRRR